MSEFEIFGAERMLMARALDGAVFDDAAQLVNDFKDYFTAAGQRVSENPSPGNLAGGIATLEEKALGAAQKAGVAALTLVLRYGERIRLRVWRCSSPRAMMRSPALPSRPPAPPYCYSPPGAARRWVFRRPAQRRT